MQKIRVVEEETNGLPEQPALEELDGEAEVSPEQPVVKPGRKNRKRRGGRKTGEDAVDPAATPAKETTRSKGWRQTPLLEPSFQPFATLKRKPGRRNGKADESGWGTEDATDVQEMGDFDFEGSLAKFDKHTVFNQIQAEDSVADEDRLVAHNRLPKAKPGTAGGKNLHYTENVLDIPNGAAKATAWKSEAGDSDGAEERASQRGSGSGRHSRRADRMERAESKLSLNRRPVSRKGSAGLQPARTLSVSTHFSSRFHLLIVTRFLSLLQNLHFTWFHPTSGVSPFQPYKCSIWKILRTMNLDFQKI